MSDSGGTKQEGGGGLGRGRRNNDVGKDGWFLSVKFNGHEDLRRLETEHGLNGVRNEKFWMGPNERERERGSGGWPLREFTTETIEFHSN